MRAWGKSLSMLLNAIASACDGGRVVVFTSKPVDTLRRVGFLAAELGVDVNVAYPSHGNEVRVYVGDGAISFRCAA